MNFCPECNFLLYYHIDTLNENDTTKTLLNFCNNCGYKEKSKDTCVYSFDHKNTNKPAKTNKYIIHDNTYPRTIHHKCPNKDCKSNKDEKLREALFSSSSKNLKITYICMVCKTEWKYN